MLTRVSILKKSNMKYIIIIILVEPFNILLSILWIQIIFIDFYFLLIKIFFYLCPFCLHLPCFNNYKKNLNNFNFDENLGELIINLTTIHLIDLY